MIHVSSDPNPYWALGKLQPTATAKSIVLTGESDQTSVSGAFRAVTGGTIVFDIARQMEKHCPKAWLFDYANPVAVYSGIVNNHTRIRALGICGGFTNHR